VVNPSDSAERLNGFCDAVVSGIRSGFFTYVCHPDCICFTGDDAVYEENMRKVCEAARECRIPLEINFLGIRKNKNYPNEKFWRIVGEVGAPVTFGFDAHTVEDAYDEASLVRALELVKKYNLNYIGRPTLRSIL
jgi:histidinol-phosphatase (PHP family)